MHESLSSFSGSVIAIDTRAASNLLFSSKHILVAFVMSRCALCERPPKRTEKILTCTGGCDECYHVDCAASKFSMNRSELLGNISFRCDSCAMQRSLLTSRTPDTSLSLPSEPENIETSILPTTAGNTTVNHSDSNASKIDAILAQLSNLATSLNNRLDTLSLSFEKRFDLLSLSVDNVTKEFRSKIEKIDAKFDALEEKLTCETSELSCKVDNVDSKFDALEDKVVGETSVLSAKVDNVDCKVQALSSTVENAVTRLSQVETESSRAELSISGIPSDISLEPRNIIAKVFTALGAPELITQVLTIKDLPRRGSAKTLNPSTSHANQQPLPTYRTFLLGLGSTMYRDHIVSLKREKKKLNANEVFETAHNGQIYINEQLSPFLYNLRKRAKAKVTEMGWKSCFIDAGGIFVRKAHGTPAVKICSDSDLDKIA